MLILFLDESGDQNLKAIDPNHPVFALAGCVFDGTYYQSVAVPSVENIKKEFFGNEKIILHSRDIRKQEQEPFLVLRNKDRRELFYEKWNQLVATLNFTTLACVIDKKRLRDQYGNSAENPYHLSLSFLMERLSMHLRELGETGKMVIESRTTADNNRLYLAYSKIMLEGSAFMEAQEFQKRIEKLEFVDKKQNIIGTQLADMLAYPIATSILPNRDKSAFEIIKPKFRAKSGKIEGFGYKVFP